MQQPNMLGSDTQQSFNEMQRLQLQLQAQYRQQQMGQSATNIGASQPQAMPQQPSFPTPGLVQQHMNQPSLAALQQQQSIGTDISMMQMQQQLVGLNHVNFNNAGAVNSTGVWNTGGINQGTGSSMDASSGTSARLMAMAGMGVGGSLTSPLLSTGLQTSAFGNESGNNNNIMNMVGSVGMSGAPNATSSTMQNMQVLLQQQRQQQQQNQGKQQQQGSSLSSNFASVQQQGLILNGNNQSNFAKFQQQQASLGGVAGGGMNMVMNGMNNASTNNGNPNLSNLSSQHQQQFFLQQQLAAMQKQQQTRNNSFGAGSAGSVAANAALAALGSGQQQQQATTVTTGAAMNNNAASGGASQTQSQTAHQNLLQQRQQHLLQQLHQHGGQQQMGGSSMLQQMQQVNGGGSFRQQGEQGSNSSAGMGMISQIPGLPQSHLLRNNTSSNNSVSSGMFNNQEHANSVTGMMQQDHQQVSGGRVGNGSKNDPTGNSPNPLMGLAGLNNLTAEQRHRLQQQGLLNSSNNVTNSIYGIGGNSAGNHSMNNDDVNSSQLADEQGMMGGRNNQFPDQAGAEMGSGGAAALDQSNNIATSIDQNDASAAMLQRSFLDGRFAGGWQSNKDLPDRRKIIFHILDVIRLMRPDTSKMSNKLPHMAKSLEEHLYRSAKSKEEYMDQSTLKKRLQTIAQGLEIQRDGSSASGHGEKRRSESVTSMLSNTQVTNNDDGSHKGFNHGGNVIDNGILVSENMSQHRDMNWNQQQNQMGLTLNKMQDGLNNPMQAGNSGKNFMRSMLGQQDQDVNNVSGDSAIGMAHNIADQQLHLHQNKLSSANTNVRVGVGGLPSNNVQQQQHATEVQQQLMNQLANMNNGTMNFQHQEELLELRNNNGMGNSLDTSLDGSFSNQNSSNLNLSNQISNSGGQSSQLLNVSHISGQNQGSRGNETWGSLGDETGVPSTVMDATGITTSTSSDPAHKKRVVLQQQQRLLLLRHASKCTAGANCSTKFCEQMVTLWKHMKSCRNKNCKTSHCFSSRCVLNHYRICKSNGKTAKCDVCGPVMLKIKQQERDDGSTDPLAMAPDPSGSSGVAINKRHLQEGMEAIQSFGVQDQDSFDTSQEATGSMQGLLHGPDNSGQSHIQQQQRLKTQLDSLRLLQRKQEELLRQQERLEEQAQNIQDPNSSQAQQIQQQQGLLQQLQRRCQQQQIVLQQRLQSHTVSLNEGQVQPLQATSLSQRESEQEEESPLESLRHLERKQEELLRQQERLQEQLQSIHDSSSPQAIQLQQQQHLLQQIQKRCQQQQIALTMRLQNKNWSASNGVLQSASQQPLSGGGQSEESQQESVRLLQRKQEELLIQQERLAEQLQSIQEPNSVQAQQIRQQQGLIQQLQNRYEQHQNSLQQNLESHSTPSVQHNDAQSPRTISNSQELPVKEQLSEAGAKVESKEQNSDELQQVNPKGQFSEGKGRRLSIGKRGMVLGFKKGDEDSTTRKRRLSGALTSKEKTQKKGKTVARQNSTTSDKSEGVEAPDSLEGKDDAKDENSGSQSEIKIVEVSSKDLDVSPSTITEKCMPVLNLLLEYEFGWVFREAVDPIALGLPDYYEVIKTPMHLERVKEKLERSDYTTIESFAQDTKLVFENAILYNGETSEVGELAQSMLNMFKKSYNSMVQACLDQETSLVKKQEVAEEKLT